MPAKAELALDARRIAWCDRVGEVLLHLIFWTVPVVFIILTRDQFELPKLTILRVLTSLLLGVWVVRMLLARGISFRRTPLDLPILVWLAWQVVTTVVSQSSLISWLGEYENFRGLLTVGNYALLYYLAVQFIRTRAQINRLLLSLFLAGLLVTGYGIAQFFGIDFIAWNPDSIAPGRYFSSLGNPNFLAAYLAMLMPLLAVFFIETDSRFRRVLLVISFIIMFFALTGTWSRGGFLGLVAALGLLALIGLGHLWRRLPGEGIAGRLGSLWRGQRLWLGVSAAVLAAVILIAATFGRHHMARMADTIVHFKDAVSVSRLHIWGPALHMIRDHPWMGTGLDTFKTVFPRYATPDFAAIDGANVSSRTAHNEILQVLATQGIIGLLLVAWLTMAWMRLWLGAYRRAADRDRLILAGLLAAWTAYSVQNLFSFGVAAIDTIYWLVLALTVLLAVSPEEQANLAPAQVPAANPAPIWAALARARGVLIPAAVAGSLVLAWMGFRLALADFQYNLGTVYRMQQRWDQSIAAFTRARRLSPHEVKYPVYLGLAYEEKAKSLPPEASREWVRNAIAAYTQGVAMNPTNAYYLGNLGRAYGMLAMLDPSQTDAYDRSLDYFRQAIHYAPVTVLFYQNLALTQLNHGDWEGFRSVLGRLAAFQAKEAAKLAFTAGNQFYNAQQLNQATACYREALGFDPDHVEAHFNLGVALAQTGALQEALSHWQQALTLRSDFEPARQMLKRYGLDR